MASEAIIDDIAELRSQDLKEGQQRLRGCGTRDVGRWGEGP